MVAARGIPDIIAALAEFVSAPEPYTSGWPGEGTPHGADGPFLEAFIPVDSGGLNGSRFVAFTSAVPGPSRLISVGIGQVGPAGYAGERRVRPRRAS